MSSSLEQLIAVASRYWPSNRNGDYRPGQQISPEARRLHELWEQEIKNINRWWAFLDELRGELPGFSIGDATATPDACFRCVVYPDKGRPLPDLHWVVVGCVSIIAPVYAVYGVQFEDREKTRVFRAMDFELQRPEIKAPAEVIARRVEAKFGFTRLPREMAQMPVSLFVQWKEPPETTLFHALFTNEPENVP
ncbi:hypothetical protein [Cystobacter fuscus]|uniref:hypothetical protein n=1 Tax=Cystobacter fuscus TaxID=43 RepID=UPI0012FDC2A3|nr:hypothetical protein [Cystobacter fuscus]